MKFTIYESIIFQIFQIFEIFGRFAPKNLSGGLADYGWEGGRSGRGVKKNIFLEADASHGGNRQIVGLVRDEVHDLRVNKFSKFSKFSKYLAAPRPKICPVDWLIPGGKVVEVDEG